MSPRKYAYIDALRGVAILLVVLVHVGQQVKNLPSFIQGITAFGQFGVQLFFVASGLTLCFSWKARNHEPLKTTAFYLRRYFRIAPMYYVGILLFKGGAITYHLIKHDPIPNEVLTGIAANILFIHGFIPYANNNIVPGGWSIGCEFIFYAIFPLVIYVCRSMKATLITLFVWVLGSCLINKLLFGHWPMVPDGTFAYASIEIQLPAFLIGFLVFYSVDQVGHRERIAAWALMILTLGTVFLGHRHWIVLPGDHYLTPLLTGLGFGSLAIILSKKEQFPRLLLEIGKRSFSIYLLHFLFTKHAIPFMWKRIPSDFPEPVATLVLLVLFVAVVAASYPLAGLTYRFIEKPMVIFGNRLIQRLQSRHLEKATA